jgi:hypothetical protein
MQLLFRRSLVDELSPSEFDYHKFWQKLVMVATLLGKDENGSDWNG